MEIALVDDESSIRDTLLSFIERFKEETGDQVSASAFSSAEAFMAKNKNQFDAIFLDIQMSGMNGMKLAHIVRESNRDVAIVFITNMAQYAIKGYEVEALSYLLKPVTYLKFSSLLSRIYQKVQLSKPMGVLNIYQLGQAYRLKMDDIRYIEVTGHKIIYHMEDKTVESWGSLKKLVSDLDPQYFVKCRSSHIVNIRYIDSVVGLEIKIGQDTIYISQSFRKQFMEKFSAYLGR